MSDERPIDQKPAPELVEFPVQLLEAWLNVPKQQYVAVNLSRGDFDKLFFAFTKLVHSLDLLQSCLVEYSFGRMDDANRTFYQSKLLLAEGNNDFRHLFMAIMASSTRRDASSDG